MQNSEQNCFYCGRPADDLHHLHLRMNSPITIPLCRFCHTKAHQSTKFFQKLKQAYEHQQSNPEYYAQINFGR